ncbi:aspartyl-phosphate phosphatase Spo0E family protein [Cohnella silvisoli]|uniref:Aspartyl-phosphate phosphatase Spo0E family protein n=1 Tax=Cohnella silvisoli TaxID=2873699 RepID=A0ABV1KYY8_9BACL|nr:aspartyl-phosphate phosphatase Spo0E family protein [Cohnella silvisoli]MCD9024291.1 aspartyl-phosphate phosphatase Spo0E family protein [Cohnella silvisoli]
MARELEELLRQIEQMRSELYELINGKRFTDQEVIVASQMLDSILNEYQRLLARKSKE